MLSKDLDLRAWGQRDAKVCVPKATHETSTDGYLAANAFLDDGQRAPVVNIVPRGRVLSSRDIFYAW